MAGQVIDNVWIPEIPIIQGVDWGGSTGHTFTAGENISGVVFSLALYRGTELITTLTEANSMITHSGNFIIYIKIPKATTATLSKGVVKGDLLGTSGGVTSLFGSISTFIR